jgi:hypothetical protein
LAFIIGGVAVIHSIHKVILKNDFTPGLTISSDNTNKKPNQMLLQRENHTYPKANEASDRPG